MFVDTNVPVAAFATRGPCAALLRHLLDDHELVPGEVVLTERRRAISRGLKLPLPTVEAIVELLREHEVALGAF